ncbi:DNA methyltransferase [Parasphingopyxis sp.]|uniref:site-specific DNA-methyltransferase n=1 Tax=Parasphingopyxis sp. TaxID=1920299 RepID=UPI0032EEEBE0
MTIEYIPIGDFVAQRRKLRTHPKSQIAKLRRSLENTGAVVPVLIDENSRIIDGHAVIEAARQLGFESYPAVRVTHLSEEEKRVLRLALNRIAEDADWDSEELKIELQELSIDFPEIDCTLTGFETTEIDRMVRDRSGDLRDLDEPVAPELVAVTRHRDVWRIGDHLVMCGDALSQDDLSILMGEDMARMVLTDPPFNVKISGHVSGSGKHREFVQASGELSDAEFNEFLFWFQLAAIKYTLDGGLFYIFMDAQHLMHLLMASHCTMLETLTICVWVKDNGGMGSFYRSQHEMVLVAKASANNTPHVNNIQLGKYGRYRTNVWRYPGVNSFGKERDAALAMHPTVKPVTMLADAILDASNPGEVILDSFGGSGSTMVAAEQTGRRARLMELDPLYVDTIIRRMERSFGLGAIHVATGQSFDETAAERAAEREIDDAA